MSASPAAWWQHACKVVLVECRRRRPACSFRLALRRRREYLSLYRALHSQQLGYNRSGRASKHKDGKLLLMFTQHCLLLACACLHTHLSEYMHVKQQPLNRPTSADQPVSASACLMLNAVPTLLRELHTIESTMTACEISTHRIFVALVHSQHLQHRPALQQQWLEALDGLGGFVDLIPGRGQGTSYSEPGKIGSVFGLSHRQQQTACPKTVVSLLVNDHQCFHGRLKTV